MKIILNGQDLDVAERTTVAGLLELRRRSGHLSTTAYAVERNQEVCPRPRHAETVLQPNDRVEIVVMVGGG